MTYFIQWDTGWRGIIVVGYARKDYRDETLTMCRKHGHRVLRVWEG